MARMTGGQALAASLVREGVETVFGLPGVQLDWAFDALYEARDSVTTYHTRHEQATAYMADGYARTTGRVGVCMMVPGPGLLNAGAALLNAYGMNAPVLALIGQIPDADIGRGFGHLHEIRDQAGIIARLVGHCARIRAPEEASALVAEAMSAMRTGRPGPAALECAIDVWGRAGEVKLVPPHPVHEPPLDEDAIVDAAKRFGAAKRVLIVCGGGAQDAAAEVTEISAMLQAPVLGYRRGRGVLDSRDPLSVTLPLGRDLWGEADVVLAVGTRLHWPITHWGIDRALAVIRIDANRDEHSRLHKPAVALTGDAKPILQHLLAELPRHNGKRASRAAELRERQADARKRMAKLQPQIAFLDAIRAELPEDGIFVDEVTQIGFAARLLFPVYRPRTFLSPGYQDPLGWGFATGLGAQHASPDVPVVAISGLFNPDFIGFAKSFGAAAERATTPEQLRGVLRRALARRDVPTVIEVRVGDMPSPWEFIFMDKVRGK